MRPDPPALEVRRPPGWAPSPRLYELVATLCRRVRDREAARQPSPGATPDLGQGKSHETVGG
jgi:hypothetical protein